MGKWLKNNWAYLLWVGIAFLWYRVYQRGQLMHRRSKYTVGYLGGWIQNIKGGRSFSYTYTVNGKEYRSSMTERYGMDRTKGARYLVEFDSIEPGESDGYQDRPLPADGPTPPPGGWNRAAYDARARADAARARADSLRNAPAVEAAKKQADAARFEQQIRENK